MNAGIVGVGIDLVVLTEFEQLLARRGESFLTRVFSADEIAYCRARHRPVQNFAARFAAKEAAFKALGTGWGSGVGWRDVEVVAVWGQAPRLALHGEFLARSQRLGVNKTSISLTHAGDYASAVVMLAQ
jgi:holo-[acyl-carrier protein] synthase